MIEWSEYKQSFKHAFGIAKEDGSFSAEDLLVIDKIAMAIVKRGLATPALLFLEGFKPLSFLGNQVLAFIEPFVKMFISKGEQYNRFMMLLEKRTSIDLLLNKIEELNNSLKKRGS